MTKKELTAIMPLLGVIRSVASEIDHLADKLREVVATFRKEAKI